jgi:hypothetical protein
MQLQSKAIGQSVLLLCILRQHVQYLKLAKYDSLTNLSDSTLCEIQAWDQLLTTVLVWFAEFSKDAAAENA